MTKKLTPNRKAINSLVRTMKLMNDVGSCGNISCEQCEFRQHREHSSKFTLLTSHGCPLNQVRACVQMITGINREKPSVPVPNTLNKSD